MGVAIEWTATGGSITADGVFSTSTTGNFRVIGTGRKRKKSDTSTVVVVPPQPTLTSIIVTPAPAGVTEGKAIGFSAVGKLSDGSTAPIGVVWSATGGTINAGGSYTAGMTPGTFRVIATNTSGSVADTVPVTVAVPQLAQIVLLPATVTLAPGGTKQFATYGRTATGDSVATPVSFTATGGALSAGGLYTAGQTTGTYRVIATSTTTTLADTSVVTIQSAALAQLILVPALATVATGGTVQFRVYGRTTAGDSVAAQATYTAAGGTIAATGLYTAGQTAGTFQVIATQTAGTLADTSAATIAPATTCASTATLLCPGDNIQAKATAAGVGATLTLQPGTYRLQTVIPLPNQSFVGQAGAIMSGARLLTGWIQNGATWYVTGQTQEFGHTAGQCTSGTACQYPEDVYRDNVLLTRVLSLGAVGPGKFFFDYAADRIYVGDDPSGHVLEGAATEYAFQGSPQGVGAGVTLQNLIIEKYANPAQDGAIGRTNMGTNWVIASCEVRYNHGAGIRGGAGVTVRQSNIHHNGQIGLLGFFPLVEDNEIAYNNTVSFAIGWEAGGLKFAFPSFATAYDEVARRNFVHHNHGRGIWADTNHDRMVWDNNRVEDNESDGLMFEVSYSATITNNVILRNGFLNPNAVEGAGIQIYSSGGTGTIVSGNTLVGNKNGIVLIQADRGSGTLGPYVTRNVSVHDNTVTLGAGQRNGAERYGGDSGLWTTNNNHFDHNTYNLQTADAAPFLWVAATKTDTQWRASGNDVTGTFNR